MKKKILIFFCTLLLLINLITIVYSYSEPPEQNPSLYEAPGPIVNTPPIPQSHTFPLNEEDHTPTEANGPQPQSVNSTTTQTPQGFQALPQPEPVNPTPQEENQENQCQPRLLNAWCLFNSNPTPQDFQALPQPEPITQTPQEDHTPTEANGPQPQSVNSTTTQTPQGFQALPQPEPVNPTTTQTSSVLDGQGIGQTLSISYNSQTGSYRIGNEVFANQYEILARLASDGDLDRNLEGIGDNNRLRNAQNQLINGNENQRAQVASRILQNSRGNTMSVAQEIDSQIFQSQGISLTSQINGIENGRLWEVNPAFRTQLFQVAGIRPSEDGYRTLLNEYNHRAEDLRILESQLTQATNQNDRTRIQEDITQARSELTTLAESVSLVYSDLNSFNQFLQSTQDSGQIMNLINEGNQCQSRWSNAWCLFHSDTTLREQYSNLLQQEISNIRTSGQYSTVEDRNNAMYLAYGRSVSALLGISESCDSRESCLNIISNHNCNSNTECEMNRVTARQLASTVFREEEISAHWSYSLLSGILSPDYSGIQAARLFGFEADYTNLPSFLREDFASQICFAKIEGYLDKEIQTGGGVSTYTTEGYYADARLQSDLRAQRTEITPDGRVSISYSYFLRAPSSTGLEFILALSYIENGEVKRIPIFSEPKRLSAGARSNDFAIFDPIIENPANVDQSSFRIGLLAIDSSGSVFLNLVSPIVRISAGDHYMDKAPQENSQGNQEARNQEANEGLSVSSMLDLMR